MNRLKNETSPYLLQHAANPVDWYPWCDEAFKAAKEQNKPVLLSVGYSACHWCHVMAHESFEKEETAQIMNDLFINIKVDREERPDIDDIYMQAVQALTQRGGWPMTVFLMPDGSPFYGGTYFPPNAGMGMPSFIEVMRVVHNAYHNQRELVIKQAETLKRALKENIFGSITGQNTLLSDRILDKAGAAIISGFDGLHGGFGREPKFPQPMNLEYLLRCYHRTKDKAILDAVSFTLSKMARGGIYDQIGGGFARYSVDAQWLVPHFEKMLYDNAQLSRLYLHAYQVTGDLFFKEIAREIYDYILREMTTAEGGFYSTTDADSEGEEGRFYVWTIDQLKAALRDMEDELPDAVKIAVEYFGLTAKGNFEGSNILHVSRKPESIAENLGLSVDELHSALELIKARLYSVRQTRVHPGLDDKILTSWNGMMLASLAEGARVLDRKDYLSAAVKSGTFIINQMRDERGRLYRTHKDGKSRLKGYLEDYANVIDAMIELYQSTFDEEWFAGARELADLVLIHFKSEDGGLYDTPDDHERLITRPRNMQDNAVPSGNGMMAKQLLRLAAYTGNNLYYEAGQKIIYALGDALIRYPQAFGESLNAADMIVSGFTEVAVIGKRDHKNTKSLLDEIQKPFRPNTVCALAGQDQSNNEQIPLLSFRTMISDKPTAYVCRDFSCQRPVISAEETSRLLEES
jgi:uncharacterized protein YyaL (SSP411 family)